MNKPVTLLSVPYDSAHYNERMGAGPLHIISGTLIDNLRSAGHIVDHKQILLQEKFPAEIASAMKLSDDIKANVALVLQAKSFPVILSGNCSATVGVIAGLNKTNTGVVWFDAHGDCETPDTTTSGFLDGMALAMLTSSCWRNLLSVHKLHSSLPGKNIMLIGARDASENEKKFIAEKNINHVKEEQLAISYEKIEAVCTELISNGITQLHLHIDVDVLDPSVAVANSYAVRNGLSKEQLFETVGYCADRIPLSSVTIASYDPRFDDMDQMRSLINELIIHILQYLQ